PPPCAPPRGGPRYPCPHCLPELAGIPHQRRLPSRRVRAGAPLDALEARLLDRLRAGGADLLRHLRLAVRRAGALVLAVRRSCADLPGDAALATEIAAGRRHGGAVP